MRSLISVFMLSAFLSCIGIPGVYGFDYDPHNGQWCPACHDMVSCFTSNLYCVPSLVETPNSGDQSTLYDNADIQIQGAANYNGICEVCHTGTNFHRNNASGDHSHFTDQRCTSCHQHGPIVMVSRNRCYECHGGNPGDVPPGDPPMFVSPSLGPSHVTHAEANSKGPSPIDCDVCHAGGVYDIDVIAGAGVCNPCHSPDGVYDGVNDLIIGAKVNWTDGVYNYDSDGKALETGKEQWCVTCHDSGTSACDGVNATDLELYYTSGHGRSAAVECLDCHDTDYTHIDGEARTYAFNSAYYGTAQSGVAYAAGYRLKYIGGEAPLMIPANYNITFGYDAELMKGTAFRLCLNCHNTAKIFDDTPGDGIDSNFKASLPNPPRNYSYSWGSGADVNEHVSHILNYVGPFADSDWDTGTNGPGGSNGRDTMTACSSCHNVHGAASAEGSTNEPMIRDGSLAGRTGYGFSYVIEDVGSGGYPWVTSTGATQATSIGAIFRYGTEENASDAMCGGSMCHGNPTPPSASSYDASGSSWGTYLEYYREWINQLIP